MDRESGVFGVVFVVVGFGVFFPPQALEFPPAGRGWGELREPPPPRRGPTAGLLQPFPPVSPVEEPPPKGKKNPKN